MSNKHFKLRKDLSINLCGVKLFRIEATRDIERHGVKTGDLGGYIEKEGNLSGNAWVYDNAKVYNNACVFGDACVYDNAQVYGNSLVYGTSCVCGHAHVYDNAQVYGNSRVDGTSCVNGYAHVYGNARVYGNALVFEDAKVFGNSRVYDSARVYGNARVYDAAMVYGKSHVYDNEIKSRGDCKNIINERYNITILPELLEIGCQCHTKEEWWNFTDREIIEMDGKSGLRWWKKWKPILMAICEAESEGGI